MNSLMVSPKKPRVWPMDSSEIRKSLPSGAGPLITLPVPLAQLTPQPGCKGSHVGWPTAPPCPSEQKAGARGHEEICEELGAELAGFPPS